MGYWVLITLCVITTAVLLFWNLKYKWGNYILTAITAAAWLALMAYHLDNPPVLITQGSTIHEWMILIYVGMALFTLIIGMYHGKAINEELNKGAKVTPLMELSEDGYRDRSRARVTERRNRRRI